MNHQVTGGPPFPGSSAVRPWSGRAVQQARALMARYLPAPCGKCGREVKATDRWVVGHKQDRITHPHLTWEPSNWQHEHRACSDSSGQAAVIAKAKADAIASIQHTLFDASGLAVFPADDTARKPPPLPVSLPATGEPIETRPDLAWSAEAMLDHPWTAEFAVVPDDASPPLYMSPVPADAVGSYGVDRPCKCCGLTAIEFIEQTERKTLRWWQRLAIVRQLEFREDGSLCHVEIDESGPRRIGKSVRLRGVALWRMKHGAALFGEVQTVIHTGSDMAICREIQRGAWRWAEATWGKTSVTKANGKESIESPDGGRWLVRSQEGVYGYDVSLGLGDECWDVKPDTITEGIEPAMMERPSAQLQLTSTAHRRATSLMRNKILNGITGEPRRGVLILIWAALHGSDPADRAVWRAASPHWSEARLQLMSDKYDAAARGEVDPSADDPDPMAGFVAQYLNVWPIRAADVQRGEPITTEHTWSPLAVARPTSLPRAVAVESWFKAGVSVALAWIVDGSAVVSVTDHADLAGAVEFVKDAGFKGTITAGKSLLEDPAFQGVRTVAGEGRVGAAADELERLIAEGAFRHDGGAHLTDQVLAIRTVAAVDGARLSSKGRADAVKAAVWAARKARSAGVGRPRVLRPSA